MKGKIITAIILTTALTASVAAPTALAATEQTPAAAVEQQSTLSSITSVTPVQDIYKTGAYYNFDFVTATGTTKIQIKYVNSTSTYHRAHGKVTIVDNGDGTETWTIPVRTSSSATFSARAKFGKVWETDYVTATYEIKSSVDRCISTGLEYPNQRYGYATTSEVVTIKVVTTADANKICLENNDTKATVTAYANNPGAMTVVDNGDGTKTWSYSKMYKEDYYRFNVWVAGSDNRLVETGKDMDVVFEVADAGEEFTDIAVYDRKYGYGTNDPTTGYDDGALVVVTGWDVCKLRVVNDETGATITASVLVDDSRVNIDSDPKEYKRVWTIRTNLKQGTYSIHTASSNFEMKDSGYDVKVTKDFKLYDVDYEPGAITIVTGKDVSKLRLLTDATGGTMTFYSTSANVTVTKDETTGQKTWVIARTLRKSTTFSVLSNVESKMVDSGIDIVT